MPIQIQDIHDQEDATDCPLCMEALEVDDINFFPCECGYQICRFCWHRIRTDENGLCPACRKPYPENPAEFKPLTDHELQKIRQEKKQKEVARKQKITDSRKHLANVRVLQKNLVFVVGLSQRLADVEILKRPEYFGKYGKILKVVLNSNTSYAGSQTPSCSAYVTYSKMEEALRAIQSVNNVHIDGRTLKASLGTTKYCSNYLKNQVCQKHDCMYLHEIGDEDASFTKEDMQMSKHQEYEQKLIQQMIQKEIQQEMKAKAMRQEGNGENGEGSAGSSPPSSAGTITSGLSVAQAVKKNTRMTHESSATSNRPRRHSTSMPSGAPPDIQDMDLQAKNHSKGSKLSSSVIDKDCAGLKASSASKATSRRTVTNKKATTVPLMSQAPRHKKQQQNTTVKKTPSRPESASPSGESSNATSVPASAGASVESSPSSTPVQRDISAGGVEVVINGQRSGSSVTQSNQSVPGFSEGSLNTMSTSAQPIDIPISSDDVNRSTPHSDSSSSIGRKSPFVREGPGLDGSNIDLNSLGIQKSKFSMLHKDGGTSEPISSIISNGLGFSPFGMNPTTNLLQDLRSQDSGLVNSQPVPKVMPPPGLSPVPIMNSTNWPVPSSRLADAMPIQSSHDWEEAFGFKAKLKEPVSSVDDDLGFDPFLECSKGLADLIEKEKTMESVSDNNSHNQFHGSSMPFGNLSQLHRPTTLQDQNRLKPSQIGGYPGGSELVNGLSNLLSNQSQLYHQHKMHFPVEQSRFLPQQRLNTDSHHLFGPSNTQKHGLLSPGSPITPTKDFKSVNQLQDMQNEFRALLPSVNINFTNQSQTQRQSAGHNMDLTLGLSNLGIPMGGDANKPPISHPPGINNGPMHNPFMNKQHMMPPPGVGFGSRTSAMRQPWGNADPSFSRPGQPSSRLAGPASLQSLFSSGGRLEQNTMHNSLLSYPPDPAIVQGSMTGFGQTTRRTRLFESPLPKTSAININNNSNEEQPHWMKSLQALTEHEPPTSPAPQTGPVPSLGQVFSQQRSNNGIPSWPNMNSIFPSNNSGFSNSQPPPGFQVRPTHSKPTEFGAFHNLLENQS